MAIVRNTVTLLDTVTINSAATSSSLEVDIGDNTLADQIWVYLKVAGFAAAPAGNEQMKIHITPSHTSGGDVFDDDPADYIFSVTADAEYLFSAPVLSLPRYFVVSVENDTAQNTDADAVSCWIEYQAIT